MPRCLQHGDILLNPRGIARDFRPRELYPVGGWLGHRLAAYRGFQREVSMTTAVWTISELKIIDHESGTLDMLSTRTLRASRGMNQRIEHFPHFWENSACGVDYGRTRSTSG